MIADYKLQYLKPLFEAACFLGMPLLWLAISCSPSAAETDGKNACPAYSIQLLKGPDGGRVDWRPDGQAIAVDRRDPSTGCYDVWEIGLRGEDLRCLTCRQPNLPGLNKGNPAYDPSGQFIVFQAEKNSHIGKNCGFYTNPGAGLFNDLWVMNFRTGQSGPLYSVPDGLGHGTIHPHFSHDGKKLLWSEMYSISGFRPPNKAGLWKLNIADVILDPSNGMPALRNIRTIFPDRDSGEGFVESHGFTPDNLHVVFSGNLGYSDLIWKHNDIHIANLDGSGLQKLTDRYYNEHGQLSPSGRSMAWMSSAWSESKDERDGTEIYWRNLPTGQTCQISHFNTKGYPESQDSTTNAADIAWSPDGRGFVGYSHDRNFKSNFAEDIWLVHFDGPQ